MLLFLRAHLHKIYGDIDDPKRLHPAKIEILEFRYVTVIVPLPKYHERYRWLPRVSQRYTTLLTVTSPLLNVNKALYTYFFLL
jgi:hypothetical protein